MLSDVTFEELSKEIDKYIIFDVRTPEEIQVTGYIPTAFCFPLKEMEEALQLDDKSFLDKYGFEKLKKDLKDKTYVTHCHKGGRGRKAGDLLGGKGFPVRVYAGSFNDWKAKGGEVLPGIPKKD